MSYEDNIYTGKIEIDNGTTIKVEILNDDTVGVADMVEGFKKLKHNPLSYDGDNSKFEYCDFAIDNFYQTAYFVVRDDRNHRHYYVLTDCPKALQSEFSKLGYSKHNAWLKAIEYLRSKATYIQDYYNDLWHYVGIQVTVTKTMVHNGLIWSNSREDSLWGIDWSIYLGENENTFNYTVPDLLLECDIKLTKEQLYDLWISLE